MLVTSRYVQYTLDAESFIEVSSKSDQYFPPGKINR